jgi:novel protein kinase C epsilon type
VRSSCSSGDDERLLWSCAFIQDNILQDSNKTFQDKFTMFNGRLKITVIGAKGLQLTNFMTRHQMAVTLEPYVAIDVDEVSIMRTSTKSKTHEPSWNETFTTDLLRNAEEVGFTVFHDSTIPPDDFIANCKLSLSELIEKEDQPLHELWVRTCRPWKDHF